MNLKLEELRKRLLDTTNPLPPGETIYRSNAEAGSSPRLEQASVTEEMAVAESKSTSAIASQPAPVASTVKQYGAGDEGNSVSPKTSYNVAQAVAKVFDSVRGHQERLAELSKSLESIEQIAQSASRAFEPIETFHTQMKKLSGTFEPMRSFQHELGAMAEAFEPMRALHEQMAQMAQAFEINLAQLARCLEPAKKFQAQLIRLAKSFETASELQAQFLELSDSFRNSPRSNGKGAVETQN
jgi:DNA repair exonuclease SbcCD ATPase subunit